MFRNARRLSSMVPVQQHKFSLQHMHGACRAVSASAPARFSPGNAELMLVTDDNHLDDKFLSKIDGALKGGATCVQLRLKHVSTREYVRLGEEVRGLTRAAGVPLLIDDRLDVALAVDADGLHIGGDDLPWRIARRLLGPEKILGCSTYGRADLVREALHPEVSADYLGSHAIFPSPTKHQSTAKGVTALSEVRRHVLAEAGSRVVPLLAIGGVDVDSAGLCVSAGADGVAVVSGLLRYEEASGTQDAATKMIEAVREALRERKADSL